MNRLLVGIPAPVKGELPVVHDTGMELMPWGDDFILPFANDMIAEEMSRVVAQAIKRDIGEPVSLFWSDDE